MRDQKHSKEDLIKIYSKLTVSAKSLLGSSSRNRPLKAAGKEAHDYVTDTLVKYLVNPEKFDPTKGKGTTLIGYLTNHLLRSLIADDFKNRKRDLKIKDSLVFQERHELSETTYLIGIY